MLYLSSPMKAHNIAAFVEASGSRLGVMLTPTHGERLDTVAAYPFWAADNGCYSQGDTFNLEAYFDWLSVMAPARSKCLFATAPDVVGDAQATWARSKDILPAIRALGYKAALVAQDGLEGMAVDWQAFDVLFVGGTTSWKLSEHAYTLVREAKRWGKWCHMGRVNSRLRLRHAQVGGYDSADGTHLSFAPDRRGAQLFRWLHEIAQQPSMDLWGISA